MFWERLFLLLNVLLAVSVIVAGLALIGLFYALGSIIRKTKGRYFALITDEGPEIHTQLPTFEGTAIDDRRVRSEDFAGRDFVLLFVSPECAPCHSLLAAIEKVRRSLLEPPSFVIIIECHEEVARRLGYRYRLHSTIIPDPHAAIRSRLRILRTPYGFLVDPQGIIRMKGVLNHQDHLEALIQRRGKSIGSSPWELLQEVSQGYREE